MEQQAGIQTGHHIVQHDPPAVLHAPVDDVGRRHLDYIEEPEEEKPEDDAPQERGTPAIVTR